jgi:hypothetical protein
MKVYEQACPKVFPPIVRVQRIENAERIMPDSDGLLTARTMIARKAGYTAVGFGFEPLDVLHHLTSSYDSRIQRPSVSEAGTGSPFISVMPVSSQTLAYYSKAFNTRATEDRRVVTMEVPRETLIVPTAFRPRGVDEHDTSWHPTALELLILGDVKSSQIISVEKL